jgi:hypothetical protein
MGVFWDPFTDMDDNCVVNDAAQRTRGIASVMTAAVSSSDAEQVLGGSSIGRRPSVDGGFDEVYARLISDYFGVNPT